MKAKPNIKVIVLAAVLILSLAANAILAVMLVSEKKHSDQDLYDPEHTVGEDTPMEGTPTGQTEASKTEIETVFITFTFPDEVEDQIAINTTKNADSTEVTFTAKAYEQLTLFQVVLAKQEPDGYILGVFNHETEGEVYVAVNVYEQNPEDWSDEQYKEICTLQEYVNDIMVQIQEDPRFVPNRPV